MKKNDEKEDLKKAVVKAAKKVRNGNWGCLGGVAIFCWIVLIFITACVECWKVTLPIGIVISVILVLVVAIASTKKSCILEEIKKQSEEAKKELQKLPQKKSEQFNAWVDKLTKIRDRKCQLSKLSPTEQLTIEQKKLSDEIEKLEGNLEQIDVQFQQLREGLEKKSKMLADIEQEFSG